MPRGKVEQVAEEPGARPRRLWSDFSYVASSGYRERVVMALTAGPKLPKQLSTDTGLRLAHVSRSLKELSTRGLAECLTPEAKSRGRVYGLTSQGMQLVAYFRTSTNRYVPLPRSPTVGFVPKIRAALAMRIVHHLRSEADPSAVSKALRGWAINPSELREDDWLPVDTYDELLELLEASFGDGTYEYIRRLCFHTVPQLGPVREQIARAIPLEALAEVAPIVYAKEWNYGRLVVKTGRRWARFDHFDWSPTPAMCAIFQGTYEGVLHSRRVRGTVEKVKCVRSGDEACEYLAKW